MAFSNSYLHTAVFDASINISKPKVSCFVMIVPAYIILHWLGMQYNCWMSSLQLSNVSTTCYYMLVFPSSLNSSCHA